MRIKSKKVCKQVRDQNVWKQVKDGEQGLLAIASYCRTKINPKAFASPL